MNRLEFATELKRLAELSSEKSKEHFAASHAVNVKRFGESERIFQTLEELKAVRNNLLSEVHDLEGKFDRLISERTKFDFEDFEG